jgi:hypothetical protein
LKSMRSRRWKRSCKSAVGKEDRVFCHALCSKTVRFAHKWNAGMLEYWSNGFEGSFDN